MLLVVSDKVGDKECICKLSQFKNRKDHFQRGGSEEVPLQLGHEGQVKCRYGDMAVDVVGRENAANRMALRWWAGSQML